MRHHYRVVLLLLVPCLGGCVAWEIRDDIRDANALLADVQCTIGDVGKQIDGVQRTIDDVGAQLADVQRTLDTANTSLSASTTTLASVDTDLDRLESTNTSLVAANTTLAQTEKQLATLTSIDHSMTKLDQHLGSLRKTISRIDNVIPFFSLGDDAPIESDAAEPTAPTEPAAEVPPAAAPAEGAAIAEPAGKDADPTSQAPAAAVRRDPLVGTWICEFPKSPSQALILLPDSSALLVTHYESGGTKIPGTWSRKGNTLTFTHTPQKIEGAPDAPAETKPLVIAYTIITQTTRTLTLDMRGQVLVFAKP